MNLRTLRSFIFSAFWLSQSCFDPLYGKIIADNGEILPEVREIFATFKALMSEEQVKLLDEPSLLNFNQLAQSLFLRPAGLERKDIATRDSRFAPYASESLRDLFKKIGDIGSCRPSKTHYDYILLHGSTVQNMRERLASLIELVQTGALQIDEKSEWVFLTGERDLFDMESREVLLNPSPLIQDPVWERPASLPKTEADAALWIYQQTLLPQALRQLKVTFVRAPKNKKVDQEGKVTLTRPTTIDTFKCWMSQSTPVPGSCLAISSQPYVYYQEVSGRIVMSKLGIRDFTLDSVGLDGSETQHPVQEAFLLRLPIYLDNLARTIYSELELSQLLKPL